MGSDAPATVAAATAAWLAESTGGAGLLFWDPRLGEPDASKVREIWQSPGDVWHAGLRLGQNGRPRLLDYIHPNWMLICDPPVDREASSWRLSLRAALVSRAVLERMGGPHAEMDSLEGTALELGHRWISRGVLLRHVPSLLPVSAGGVEIPPVTLADEILFAHLRCSRLWTAWALGWSLLTGDIPALYAVDTWRRVRCVPRYSEPGPFHRDRAVSDRAVDSEPKPVTVLIPTLDRYPYLRTLLDQLRRQTVPPQQILVIDQTEKERRQDLTADHRDLPLEVLTLDAAGQCSARNAGLHQVNNEHVLFLDDDDEIEPDLIARHLATLERFRADVSCGVADEVGAGPLPAEFTLLRTSDVFPTNNSMIRRQALYRSGLFDLAYDRGSRADGDLGMRLYLSGALMVLDPSISVLHHHAPRGGLRRHRARVKTYASSRHRLLDRHLPSVTEIYLAQRYFSRRQVRAMLSQRTAGTLRLKGGKLKRALKVVVGLLLLPDTLIRTWKRTRVAREMRERFPQIDRLADRPYDSATPPS